MLFFFNPDASYMDEFYFWKCIKLYSYDKCNFLYVKYTSIKAFAKKKKNQIARILPKLDACLS